MANCKWDFEEEIETTHIDMRSGFVYLITNKITNGTYVGATTLPIKKRWKFHRKNRKRGNSPLYKAMCEYGSDNFRIEHIASVIRMTDLSQFEIDVIVNRKPDYNRYFTPSDVWRNATPEKPLQDSFKVALQQLLEVDQLRSR